MKRALRNGFTLIELLVVIAITAILMTVIVIPIYDSFNYTRYAQAFSDAQSKARIVADRIARDIGNSNGARNTNYLVPTTLNGNAASIAANSLIVRVPMIGGTTSAAPQQIEVVLPYVKMDLVEPAEGQVPANPALGYTNPYNGLIDPTLQSPKGQPVLPGGPGATIIRYFIGLRNPFVAYNDPYSGLLMAFNGNRDNLFVLYKAEVQPLVYRAGQGSNGDNSQRYRPNLEYFQSDAVTDTQIVNIDDPRFFLNDGALNIGIGINKNARVENWLLVSKLQTELTRYDLIQPIYDKASHVVTYNGGAPEIVPLIQFRPEHISNDAAQGQVAVREGEETNNAAERSDRTSFAPNTAFGATRSHAFGRKVGAPPPAAPSNSISSVEAIRPTDSQARLRDTASTTTTPTCRRPTTTREPRRSTCTLTISCPGRRAGIRSARRSARRTAAPDGCRTRRSYPALRLGI